MRSEPILRLNLNQPLGQLRAAPVSLGKGKPSAFITAYSADFDVDPYFEMFFLPTDTLKLALFTAEGERLWQRDLGKDVLPGLWFTPIFPFDLDGDGVDEIYFVNNVTPNHPLSLNGLRLEQLDPRSGKTVGQWEWPLHSLHEPMSHTYRFFIMGGYAQGRPILVTASGTYGTMRLCGFGKGMNKLWETIIPADAPGARGPHMCPVIDIDNDGTDEILWGERCLDIGTGKQKWCADEATYRGHSDVIQPVLDEATGKWSLYVCRETHGEVSPRILLYDDQGRRVWGVVGEGHIDMGWAARLGESGQKRVYGLRISTKSCGADGRFHHDREEFFLDALSGAPVVPLVAPYGCLPVDLDGDGMHELVRGIPGQDGAIFDRKGTRLGCVGGLVALANKFMDLPGEQLLVYKPDGALEVWADRDAKDSSRALARYAHPFYRLSKRFTASRYNLPALGGL